MFLLRTLKPLRIHFLCHMTVSLSSCHCGGELEEQSVCLTETEQVL